MVIEDDSCYVVDVAAASAAVVVVRWVDRRSDRQSILRGACTDCHDDVTIWIGNYYCEEIRYYYIDVVVAVDDNDVVSSHCGVGATESVIVYLHVHGLALSVPPVGSVADHGGNAAAAAAAADGVVVDIDMDAFHSPLRCLVHCLAPALGHQNCRFRRFRIGRLLHYGHVDALDRHHHNGHDEFGLRLDADDYLIAYPSLSTVVVIVPAPTTPEMIRKEKRQDNATEYRRSR